METSLPEDAEPTEETHKRFLLKIRFAEHEWAEAEKRIPRPEAGFANRIRDLVLAAKVTAVATPDGRKPRVKRPVDRAIWVSKEEKNALTAAAKASGFDSVPEWIRAVILASPLRSDSGAPERKNKRRTRIVTERGRVILLLELIAIQFQAICDRTGAPAGDTEVRLWTLFAMRALARQIDELREEALL